jgi:hypothetical protein
MERFSRRTISMSLQGPPDLDSLPTVAEDESDDDESAPLPGGQKPLDGTGDRDAALSIS